MMSERARALEQALLAIRHVLQGVSPCAAINAAAEAWSIANQALLAVDPPPSGASPQAETSAHVRALTVHICEDCLNLRGEMCNEPGCRFCRRTMAEVAEYLDVLLIRPRIDGVSVLVDEGTALPTSVSPVEPEPVSRFADVMARVFNLTEREQVYVYEQAQTLAHQLQQAQPTVEPEPCAWRITSGPLGTWVNPTCVEGAIPAPWGTERAKACHLCGAPLKVER